MGDFSSLLRAYLEVGILGLCGILVVLITFLNYKRNSKRAEEQDKSEDDRFNKMFEMFKKQNEEYISQNNKNYELLMQKLVSGNTSHVLTPEEDRKITKINDEVNKILQQLLISTNASRASLIQYHNGGKGKNNQSFLKMSMTNEVTNIGIKPLISDFKDQFRNVLAYFVKEINDSGYCYINDSEDIKSIDYGMYDFMSNRGIKSKYGIALHQSISDDCNEKNIIGFICLEFLDDRKYVANVDIIDSELRREQAILETLLSL